MIQSDPKSAKSLVQHRTHIVRRFTCGTHHCDRLYIGPQRQSVVPGEDAQRETMCILAYGCGLLCRCTAPAPGKVIVNSHLSIYQFVYYNLILCCCPLHQFIHFHPAAKLNQLSQVNSKKQTPTNRPHKWHNLCNHDWGINRCRAFAAFALHAEPTTMEWNPNLSNSRSEALVLQKDHLGAQVGHDFKSECKNRLISIASDHFYWIKRARRSNRDRIRGVFFKFREAAWIFFVMDVKLL